MSSKCLIDGYCELLIPKISLLFVSLFTVLYYINKLAQVSMMYS